MPNWFKKTLHAVGDAIDDIRDDMMDQWEDLDFTPNLEQLTEAGAKSNTLARETIELCLSTHSKSLQMMEFCTDLKETFETTTRGGIQADTLDTIQDLLSGEKLQNAMELAKEMSQSAGTCIERSVAMVSIMEEAMDALPDPLQNVLDGALKEKSDTEETSTASKDRGGPSNQITSLDEDIGEVKECLQAIGDLNLVTALQVGMRAMEQLSRKAHTSRQMFGSLSDYAKEIADITDAFANLDFGKIILHKVKAIWKCLKLSGLMKALAEGLGSLIQLVVDLFEATSSKVAGLWKALAYAKDCMKDCIEHAMQARGLCNHAKTRSMDLVKQCGTIKDFLSDMGELNSGSFRALKDLADGDEIRSAIAIASEMDDIVLDCASKAVAMIDRVREGFENLPSIVTEGITDDDGVQDDDPDPADVEQNVKDLEANREEINNATVVEAIQVGSRGFSNASDQVTNTQDLIQMVRSFAENCMAVLQSFMGVWDLPTAIQRVQEMCRIVKVGQMMKQFADQIKRVILAVIDFLQTTIEKFQSMDIGDMAQGAVELVQNLDLDDVKAVGAKIGSFFRGKNNDD